MKKEVIKRNPSTSAVKINKDKRKFRIMVFILTPAEKVANKCSVNTVHLKWLSGAKLEASRQNILNFYFNEKPCFAILASL